MVTEDSSLIDRYVSWARMTDTATLTDAFYAVPRTASQAAIVDQARKELCNWFPRDTADDLLRRLADQVRCDRIDERALRSTASRGNAHWKQPATTVPAQEYWETYFQQNPHQAPRHRVYYSGDPNQAVANFLAEHGIGAIDSSDIDESLLRLNGNHVTDMRNDPRAKIGYTETMAAARAIIDAHFQVSVPETPTATTRWNSGALRAIRRFLGR